MSIPVPNPLYAVAKKMIEARVRREVAKYRAAASGCGQPSCGHAPVLRQFVPTQDHPTMPGFYQKLNDTPSKTGIVYVNGEFHSVHPPGSNRQNELTLAGGPEVRPGEAATYSSEADSVHFTSGCPHCEVSRGLDGNLYDAKGIITTEITSGCTPCPANCSHAAVAPLRVAASVNKNTQDSEALGAADRRTIPML